MTAALRRERTPLLAAIEKLGPHDHPCLLYSTKQEQFAVVIPFLRFGLERGERCVYIVDESTADEVLRALKDDGVDVAAAVSAGALSVIGKKDSYLKEGSFDPERMIRFLEEAAAKAEVQGYAALRIVGEMTWALGPEAGVERLIEYAAKLNGVFPRLKLSGICQYDRARFGPALIKEVIHTHPCVISDGVVAANPFFIPMLEYLAPVPLIAEADRLLRSIVDSQKAHDEILGQAVEAMRLYDDAPCGYFSLDGDGVFVRINETGLRWLGYARAGIVSRMKFAELITSVDRKRFEDDFTNFKERGAVRDQEFDMVRKDGSILTVLMSATAVRDVSGRFVMSLSTIYDNTLRKKEQQANVRLAAIVDSSDDAILSKDLDGKITAWNTGARKLFGYEAGEVLGQSFALLVPPEGPHDDAWILSAVRRGEHITAYETTRISKDGRRIRVSITVSPIRDGAGVIVGASVISHDLTLRLLAEEKLRRSEEELREAQRIARLGSSSWAVATDTVYWSDEFHRMVGHDPKAPALSYQQHLKLYSPESAARLDAVVQEVLKSGTSYELDLDLVLPDGAHRTVLARGDAVRDASGKAVILRGTLQDITERKQAEQKQRKTSRALRTLSLCNEAVVRASDEQDLLAKICESAIRGGGYLMAWIGYRQDDAMKTIRPVAQAGDKDGYLEHLGVTWGDDARGQSPTGTAVRTRSVAVCQDIRTDPRMEPWRGEARKRGYASSISLPLLSGEECLGAMTIYSREPDAFGEEEIVLLKELSDDLAYGIVSQRTHEESLRGQEQIRRLNADLEERVRARTAQVEAVNKELEAFTYSVSHDLRAPLRTIDGFSQILVEDYAPKLEPECRRYLGLVRNGALAMAQLIDDLLAFSRLGRQALAKSPVSMEEVVRAAMESLEEQRQGRQVSFKVGELAPCEGDPALLKQVWINLLSNALKYTRTRPEALIEIDSHDEAGETVYRVKDNGVGFDMRYIDKLFTVFSRLHAKEEYEGTGVGLAIVARIVARHGGRAWARAEPGRGAEFLFTLGGSKP